MHTIRNRDVKVKEYCKSTALRGVTFHSVNSEVGLSVPAMKRGHICCICCMYKSRDLLKNGTVLKKQF